MYITEVKNGLSLSLLSLSLSLSLSLYNTIDIDANLILRQNSWGSNVNFQWTKTFVPE